MNAFMWAQEKAFGDEAAGDMSELERLRTAHDCDDLDVEASERAKIWRATAEYFGSNRSWWIPGTPVLMLYGENEPMMEDHADYLESHLEACESAEIPDAGHNSHVDNPEFIRAQIREFLASHTPIVDTEPPR